MIHDGNGVVEFVGKTRLPRFTPLPPFYPFQLAETKAQGSAFIFLDDIVPAQIEIVKNGLLLPREALVYGLPIWAFSVTSKIGVMLLKTGLEFIERPRKVGK